MTHGYLLKTALAIIPGGLLPNLVYNLALRRAGKSGTGADSAVAGRVLESSGLPYDVTDKLKPGVTKFDTGTNMLRVGRGTHSGLVAHDIGAATNPGWTRLLRRTGVVAPIVGSIGASWAPTDDTRKDWAVYSTLAGAPRAFGEMMAGTKGVKALHAAGGSPVAKWLAMSRVPWAITALTAPGAAYFASRPEKRTFDNWFRQR